MRFEPSKERFAGPEGARFIAPLLVVAMPLAMWIGLTQATIAASPDSAAIITYLERTLDWYRQSSVEQQISAGSTDAVIVGGNHQLADQIVELSFEFARAEAASQAKQSGTVQTPDQNPSSTQSSSLAQLSARLDNEVQQLQAQLESERQKSESATGRKRQQLEATVAETQSALELAKARKDAVDNVAEFATEAGNAGQGAGNLRAQIEALARGVPAAAANATAPKEGSPSTNKQVNASPLSVSQRPEPTGIWDLVSELFAISRNLNTLNERISSTDDLYRSADQFRTPLVNSLKELSQQGDDLAAHAASQDAASLDHEKKELDGLTAEFKQTTARVLPLIKVRILLGVYKRNLTDWKVTVKAQFSSVLRGLLARLGFLAAILGVIFGLAEIWRRTIFSYVHDLRRRHQLLLLRRFVLSFTVIVVIALAFANELTSVVTFAGLLTAGVAVALQSVILSVAGYFFLIGKYGIKVGDRVQIAGVTGEVVDVGLVRLHVVELGSGGTSIPSGRVVAFPNSVVFQPGAGLFKQIPGTNFDWHELTLTLPGDSDWTAVEKRVRDTMDSVFSEFREEMERQNQQMQTMLSSTSLSPLQPTCRLHSTASGLEVVVRYPVDYSHAAEIDDRMTRELLNAIKLEPNIERSGSAPPTVKLTTVPSAANTPTS